jgi:cellulose synthase/poly-beta-1,6-N-acetylglucosamine synthase-like glycosyltransferase
MPELSTTEVAFWLIMVLMLYTLKGYPILLSILASFKKEPYFGPSVDQPMVSFIVAAYNEEKNIAAKIENLMQVEHDRDKVEFIIGSDASTDNTDRILAEAVKKDTRIKYFRLDQRGGKVAVLHRAIEMANGSIVIFTDCSVRTDPDIMPIILSSFHDEKVGLVSSRDVWVDEVEGSPLTQHQYIDYEMKIRRLESRLNSTVTASGSFFAVRRELYRDYGDSQADDFALPLQVYRQGHKVIHRDDLIGYVPMVKSSGAEFSRRTRIVQAGIRTIFANLSLLNPLRYPVFAWQLWSHKVLKWFFPFMLIASILLALNLWDMTIIYKAFILGIVLLALMGLAGFLVKGRSALLKPLNSANFILLSILAVLMAWYNIIVGGEDKTWEPSHR